MWWNENNRIKQLTRKTFIVKNKFNEKKETAAKFSGKMFTMLTFVLKKKK